jgi:cation diffusion facilitator CzcD-associated flavoprotein CzcO
MQQLGPNPAVVIGAGPYGLAVAAHLRGRDVPVRVFGDPMASWRDQMPPGMFLKSTPDASSVSAPAPGYTLADYCRQAGREPLGRDEPVPIDLFIRYGQWFQHELVPDVEPNRVTDVRRLNGQGEGVEGLAVTLDTGEEIRTGVVVVASGLSNFPYVPPELAALSPGSLSPDGPVSHSAQYGDMSALAGADVIVVGAGQSALESAVLLHESGARPHLVARGRIRFADAPPAGAVPRSTALRQPPSPLGPGWRHVAVASLPASFRYLPTPTRLGLVKRILGPSGAWWLRDRFIDRVPVHSGHRIVGARMVGRRVALELADRDGATRTLTADHVLAATGYRVDVDRLPFLDDATRAAVIRVGGSPRLGPYFESSVRGLFFPGLAAAATFGPLQRFVCGTRFAAERIATTVAVRSRDLVRR